MHLRAQIFIVLNQNPFNGAIEGCVCCWVFGIMVVNHSFNHVEKDVMKIPATSTVLK